MLELNAAIDALVQMIDSGFDATSWRVAGNLDDTYGIGNIA